VTKNIDVAQVSLANSNSFLISDFFLLMNPQNKNLSVASPDIESAAIKEQGPGITSTF
jgi:hypothetical protein